MEEKTKKYIMLAGGLSLGGLALAKRRTISTHIRNIGGKLVRTKGKPKTNVTETKLTDPSISKNKLNNTIRIRRRLEYLEQQSPYIKLTKDKNERVREIKRISKQYPYPFSRFVGLLEFEKNINVKSYIRKGKRVKAHKKKIINSIAGASLLTAAYLKRRPLAIGLYKGIHKTPAGLNNKLGQVKSNLFNYLAKKSGKRVEVDPKRGYTLWKNKAGDLNSISVVNGHSIEFATNRVSTKNGMSLFQMDFKIDDTYALREGTKSGNKIITEINRTFKSHIQELDEGYVRIKPFADDSIGSKRRSLIFRRYGFTELPDKKDGYLYLPFYKGKPVKVNKNNYEAILEDIQGFD